MTKVRLFYGSSTGHTKAVAETLHIMLGGLVEGAFDIAHAAPKDLADADGLILGLSTWDQGAPQEHWRPMLPKLALMDLTGKKIALFGLGDSDAFSGLFVNGLAILHDALVDRGAKIIGAWPVDGYAFSHSNAVRDGRFVGLVIDQVNQSALTFERVRSWVDLIRPDFIDGAARAAEPLLGSMIPPAQDRDLRRDSDPGPDSSL